MAVSKSEGRREGLELLVNWLDFVCLFLWLILLSLKKKITDLSSIKVKLTPEQSKSSGVLALVGGADLSQGCWPEPRMLAHIWNPRTHLGGWNRRTERSKAA